MIFLFVLGLTILLLIAIALQMYHNAKIDRLAEPIYEHIVQKARTRANEIVGTAMDQARQLRIEGELKGIKSVAQNKVTAKKLLAEYEQTLDELASQTKQYVTSRAAETAASYVSLSDSLEKEMQMEVSTLRETFKAGNEALEKSLRELKTMSQAAKESQQQIAEQVRAQADQHLQQVIKDIAAREEGVVAEFETRLAKLHEEIASEVTARIGAALADTEAEIRTYKQKRLEIIDHDLVGVVEHVTANVLGKKLSVDEHIDLAKRAVRDAGKEGVFSGGAAVQQDVT